ncbi:MAG: tRNA (adenosine(37)-N6)-threonylcarbamoyltransferase complex ATPase subunit type 1 TsaE [Cyclobacteriaceae bacterium]|nr:tRNA (adenosine(37)-N6)-threonylcarbamoyltransferase complex ATPase subunit type 1 TsaE [Cyclobacteriaceae bacterium]
MPDGWHTVGNGERVSLEGLASAADELIKAAMQHNVWLFFGEMGSGKTTLIKKICSRLGVTDTMSSPTFSLVNEYAAGKKTIYHFDLYRLNNELEVADIGMDEYFGSGNLCLIEWPEKLGTLTPPENFKIRLTPSGPDHRVIEYQRS